MKQSNIIILMLGLITTVVIGFVLYQLSSILLPFIIAVFLSYIFRPIILYLDKRKFPRVVSIIIVIVIVAGAMFGLYSIFRSSATAFVEALPNYESKLQNIIAQGGGRFNQVATLLGMDPGQISWRDSFQMSSVTGLLTSGLGSILSLMSNLFLILLFLLFLLAGVGNLPPKIRLAFSGNHADRIAWIVANIDKRVRQYLVTKTAISLASGIITWLILLIIGVDFALLWGFLAFLLNFIPNVGSIISCLLPTAVAVVQFDSWTQPILVVALLVGMNNILGNVIEPKVLGNSLNLSPVVVLVSLIFWGWLWGIPGMILAVPLTSMLKIILENVRPLRPIGMLMSGSITPPS